MKYIEMPMAEAQAKKWKLGRETYGGDAFVGNPLEELYEEMVDALNFVEEADHQCLVHIAWAEDVGRKLRHLAEAVRRQWLHGGIQ